jgi:hypothetical protein
MLTMQMHLDELLLLDVESYHVMFRELGDMLLKREKWDRALECLEAVNACEQVGVTSQWDRPHTC